MSERFIIYAIVSIVFVAGISGCATNGVTDPTQVGFGGGLAYQIGMNSTLDDELERLGERTSTLQQELDKSKNQLNDSKGKTKALEEKLSNTKFRTQKAADKARKVSAELKLLRQDLNNKEKELEDLENKIDLMKRKKSDKRETLRGLEQAEKELSQTKQEISVLTDYLNNNLYIRAENALMYD